MNSSHTSIAELKTPPGPVAIPDQAVDMFTERGFALANRLAKAYASSDAVPAAFRDQNLKRVGNNEVWVENPSAIGNCLVAIEVARAVGMSITAVMQNADMIEGKLRWSGKFVIAAINASRRFTPLRFHMVTRGRIKAKYKEKTGWDNQARRPIFTDREVEVDDIECVAWALPYGMAVPNFSLEQLRKAPLLELLRASGAPLIESAPVTMRMAVEEGWYGKSGSKWQTEMRTLMFQYRAGSFFGNIHAPDVVMGMGRTQEEALDMVATVDYSPDGSHTVTMEEVRTSARQVPNVEEVRAPEPSTGEVPPPADAPPRPSAFDANAFAERLEACKTLAELQAMGPELQAVEDDDARSVLEDVFMRRQAELEPPQGDPAPKPAAAPASRRGSPRSPTTPME